MRKVRSTNQTETFSLDKKESIALEISEDTKTENSNLIKQKCLQMLKNPLFHNDEKKYQLNLICAQGLFDHQLSTYLAILQKEVEERFYDETTNKHAFLESYEQKLNDHVFLLEELIDILTYEYDNRIIKTRQKFTEYLLPHKRAIEKIENEINDIDNELKKLEHDTLVDNVEKEKIGNAFLRKRKELVSIQQAESSKLSRMKVLSLSIKDGVTQFRDLIRSLDRKLTSFKRRSTYIEKLGRLGAEIPKFRSILRRFQPDLTSISIG